MKGLPEWFPELKIVFQEAGIGWVPYLKWRMDDIYLEGDFYPALGRLPSEYLGEKYFFTTQPLGHTWSGADHMAAAIEQAGRKPSCTHRTCHTPRSTPPRELFDRVVSRCDEKTVRGLMGETATDLFGLKDRV